jgi:hypothetical protein
MPVLACLTCFAEKGSTPLVAESPTVSSWYLTKAAAALVLTTLFAGCSTESYIGARAISVQGKHAHRSCAQLLAEHKGTSKQIDDLGQLIGKAQEGAGGTLIGAAVYGPTLAQARAERRILEEAIEEKRCQETAKPDVSAAPAAPRR